MEGRGEKEDMRMLGKGRGNRKKTQDFSSLLICLRIIPKTMAQWIAILFSSNTMDELAQLFLPIYMILGYRHRHPRGLAGLKVQDDKITGLTMVPTAVRRLSQSHWPQSVVLLCEASPCTWFSSQHDSWVLGSRGGPSSLGVGPEVQEYHFPYIIMVKAHPKDHCDSGAEISSAP